MSSTTYTISNWNAGLAWGPEKGERPQPTPKELIATRAVETKDGWRGQVIIDSEIVWETEPITGSGEDEAASTFVQRQANAYVIDRIKSLFV